MIRVVRRLGDLPALASRVVELPREVAAAVFGEREAAVAKREVVTDGSSAAASSIYRLLRAMPGVVDVDDVEVGLIEGEGGYVHADAGISLDARGIWGMSVTTLVGYGGPTLARREAALLALLDRVRERAEAASRGLRQALPQPAAADDLDAYQREAAALAAYRLADPRADLVKCALGLAEECGEVARLVHRVVQGRPDAQKELDAHLRDELGDVLWHVAALATAAGLSLGEVAEGNLAKLRARRGAR